MSKDPYIEYIKRCSLPFKKCAYARGKFTHTMMRNPFSKDGIKGMHMSMLVFNVDLITRMLAMFLCDAAEYLGDRGKRYLPRETVFTGDELELEFNKFKIYFHENGIVHSEPLNDELSGLCLHNEEDRHKCYDIIIKTVKENKRKEKEVMKNGHP